MSKINECGIGSRKAYSHYSSHNKLVNQASKRFDPTEMDLEAGDYILKEIEEVEKRIM